MAVSETVVFKGVVVKTTGRGYKVSVADYLGKQRVIFVPKSSIDSMRVQGSITTFTVPAKLAFKNKLLMSNITLEGA